MSQNLFKIYDGRDYFWQWDTGQKLIVLNDDVDQVHFSNNKMTYAIVKEVFTDSDGTRICEVPDVILKTPNSLIAYAYVIEEDQNKTIDAIKYSVHSRQAPEDYTYEENNRFKDLVNKIELIEDAVEKVTDVKKFDTIEEAEQWAMESNEVGRVITINIDSKWTAYMVDSDHSVSKVHDNSDLIEYIDNLSKLIGNESVSDQIKNAIEALDLSNTYASKSHNHTKDDITDFAHTHEITDVNGLQYALDGKQPSGDYALKSDIKEAPVQSVNGQTGNVEITVDSIGAQPAGNYALQSDIDNLGKLSKKDIVEKSDFASDVQTSLNKADTALQSYIETDPTVPAWAKEATKPTYTASEVGALPDTTKIPSIEGLASEEYVDDKIAAIPTPDVSGQIDTHNASTNAHANMGWLTGEDEIVDSPVPIDADTLGGRSASYFEDKIAEIKNNNTALTCITFEGSPTESTVGAVGMLGMDTLTGDVWKCVSVDAGVYEWNKMNGASEAVLYVEQNLTEVQKNQVRNNIGAMPSGTLHTVTDKLLSLDGKHGQIINVSGETTDSVKLIHHGSNFLRPYTGSATVNGLAITSNEDGSMHVSGTISSAGFLNVATKTNPQYLPAGKYLLGAEGPRDNNWQFTITTVDSSLTRYVTFDPNPRYAVFEVSEPVEITSFWTFRPGNDPKYDGDFYAYLELHPGDPAKIKAEPYRGEVIESTLSINIPAFEGTNNLYTRNNDTLTASMYTGLPPEIDEALDKKLTDRGVLFDFTQYNLPVLYLTGDTSTMTKENPVDLQYVYGDRTGTATVKWQGSSSLAYPKKNYTIKFDNAFEAAPGWGEQKKYCLKANFIDHSHARNVVSAKLWGQIVKTRSVTDDVFDMDSVTGAIDFTYGSDNSNRIAIEDGVITVENIYPYFTGNSISKGKYTVYWEAKPTSEEGGEYNAFWSYGGTVGNAIFNKKYYADYPTGKLEDGWYYFTEEVEFTEDGSMIGFGPHMGTPFRFRNISIEPISDVLTTGIKEIIGLPNGGAIDGFPVIIALNGDFHGLYTFNIPKDGWMFGMGSGEKEAIVCANTHSAPTGFWQEALMDESDFELEYVSNEDNTDWILPSLNTLINACINSDGTDLDTTVAQYLDWQSAIDYYIFVMLLKGGDMMDKNYLLATFNGTKWFFSAYDMDSTYGLVWTGRSIESSKGCSVITFAGSHKVMDLIRKYKTKELKTRYAEIRDTIMSEDNVALEFLNFVGLIPTVIFNEDVRKWPTIPSTASSNVAQILNWYRMRVAVLDKEIEALPTHD